jgi:putative SOS response-associated peptidase YedK
MPVILAEEHHEAWLSNHGKEVLVPFPAAAMRAWPISPSVNSPKNNDPDLLVPVQEIKEYD